MSKTSNNCGLKFSELAKGSERNLCCSYLVNLDHDLINLILPDKTFLDAARDILVGHTNRIFDEITKR